VDAFNKKSVVKKTLLFWFSFRPIYKLTAQSKKIFTDLS